MPKERYSEMTEEAAFGFFINAMESRSGGDGDTGCSFPRSDAEDLSRGARFIPGDVTLARRAGKKVNFLTECGPNCWYWEFPDGARIYHFDAATYRSIATANGCIEVKDEHGGTAFEGGAGACPDCGNLHTGGDRVKP